MTGNTADVTLEPPTLDDGQRLWALARISGLDLNSPYAYVLWCRDFAATSLVARDRTGTIRGFVTGYVRPEAPDTYFLWQIAVDPAYRGRRLARRMLDCIGSRITERGIRYLEATVTPGNTASRALFASFARARAAALSWTPLFERGHFPAETPEQHEPEDLVRIGPLR